MSARTLTYGVGQTLGYTLVHRIGIHLLLAMKRPPRFPLRLAATYYVGNRSFLEKAVMDYRSVSKECCVLKVLKTQRLGFAWITLIHDLLSGLD